VTFSVPPMGGDTDVAEQWIYTCEYKVYVTIDLSTINEPTPCACGLALSAPPKHAIGNVQTEYQTQVPNATIVIYDERRNKVLGELGEFEFQPNAATKALLEMGAKTGDFMGAVAGFSGVVQAFPNKPALLDNTKPGQENNVAALCFTVIQRFRSSYQWPEPPFPTLHTPPNIYKSDCIPYVRENPHSYKRHEQQAGATTLWFREFLVFANTDTSKGGFNPRNRYITSYYVNSACTVTAGYVSFDRHFVSAMQRTAEAYGVFQWRRDYTDVYVVGGVPADFTQATNFFADGYYTIVWRQPYSVDEGGTQAFRPGVLAANLIGVEHADDPNSKGGNFKLCDSVPELWKTCAGGTAGCAAQNPTQLDNDPKTWVWPTAKAGQDPALKQQLDALKCAPAFTRCATDVTWLGFQNYGLAARDFSKRPTAHLLTGPRQFFCGQVRDVLFDTLKFKPHTVGKAIRRRRKRALLAPAEHQNHADFDFAGARKRGTTVLETMQDPIAEALPSVQDTTLRPAVGSTDADGTNSANAGDHPLALFPEQYTVPMSVREEDRSCGSEYGRGTVDTSGCVAKALSEAPPCIKGQLGCSCRTIAQRTKCDAPLECVDSFCMKPQCAAGTPGCPCAAGNACEAGAVCGADARCYADDAACPEGDAGCMCKVGADGAETCNGALQCVAGACADVSGTCADGTRGCQCAAGGACTDGAAFECQPELNVCVSKAFCERGAGGCKCARGDRCAAGFECVASQGKRCAQPKCPPGERGCPCDAAGGCSAPNYKCVALTVSGSQSACLAEVVCGDQSKRCENYCGAKNVKYCPACDHELPECHVDVASAPAARAASLALLLVAALLAALLH